MLFEWDENKRAINLAKHKLDLARGVDLFDGRAVVTYASPRGDEVRSVCVGLLGLNMVAVVWTKRDGGIRLISLRRARHAEERTYRARFG